MTTPYDDDFYEMQRRGSARSAAVVMPVVLSQIDASSVLDVGCGVGTWLKEAQRQGIANICGVDGSHINTELLQIPEDAFVPHDLTRPLHLHRQFDLVICLEVAEHLDEQYADQLVHTLTEHGSNVLFSAAIPGQRGHHHVNCQWQSYWKAKFASRGFNATDVIRTRIWNESEVDIFYRQNMLFYARQQSQMAHSWPEMAVVDLVHPAEYLRQLKVAKAPGVVPALQAMARSIRNAIQRRIGSRRI